MHMEDDNRPLRPLPSFKKPVPRPIQIHFDDDKVASMLSLLKQSRLPTKPPMPAAKWDLGIDLDSLGAAKSQFESEWSVKDLEDKINRYPNYTVSIPMDPPVDDEEPEPPVDIHFVHAKSQRKDAIPLLMLHGWPGTFFDFHKVIESLINPPEGQTA